MGVSKHCFVNLTDFSTRSNLLCKSDRFRSTLLCKSDFLQKLKKGTINEVESLPMSKETKFPQAFLISPHRLYIALVDIAIVASSVSS